MYLMRFIRHLCYHQGIVTMNHYLLCVVRGHLTSYRLVRWILVVASIVCCTVQTTVAQNQPPRIYAVLSPQTWGYYKTDGPARLGSSRNLVGFLQKRGLLWFNLDSMTVQLYNADVADLENLEFAWFAKVGNGLRMYARSFYGRMFMIDSTFSLRPMAISGIPIDKTPGSNNGPYLCLLSNTVYSANLADSVNLSEQFRGCSMNEVDSVVFMTDSLDWVYYMTSWDFPALHRFPVRQNRESQLVSDRPPAWNGSKWYTQIYNPPQRLYSYVPGDTALVAIDSMLIDGIRRRVRPDQLGRLWSDSILYQDRSGFVGMIVGDTMTTPSFPFVPQTFRVENEGAHLFRFDADSVRIAFTDRRRWPTWIQWSVHPDFQPEYRHTWRGQFPNRFLYGDLGVSLGRTTEPSSLVSSPAHPYPFELGCLVGQDTTFPGYQGMLVTWRDRQGRPMVVSDQGCVTRIVRQGFGYVTHPMLFHDELKNLVSNMYLPSFRYGALPWFGVRRPQPWSTDDGDTLVHPGKVVRRLHRSGDMLDTLSTTPAQAWCRLSADRWAHANHRAVTIVGPKGSTTLATPYDTTRLKPGYASSLTPLADGSILVSYYGAVRTDTTLSTKPYRRGGMVHLGTNGTATSVALPDDAGGYIYPVQRMNDGTLLALSATFTDDTVIGIDENRQYLDNVRVLRSTDDGATWRASSTLFYNGPWLPTTGRFLRTSATTILGLMPGSVIVSNDNGATWDFDSRFDISLSVSDFDISADTVLLATDKGLYRQVLTTTSVSGDKPRPLSASGTTMSREAFQKFIAAHDDKAVVVDLLGRRITDYLSLPSGTIVFIRTETGSTRVYIE